MAGLTMSKIGRNDPCPSGAGVKFKKCLCRHPGLGLQSSAGAIWWVCDRWQADEPDLVGVLDAWRRMSNPPSDKFEHFLERMFAESVDTVDWERLMRDCHAKRHSDLLGLYRRVSQLLVGAPGQQPGFVQNAATEIFMPDHPEMYAEILDATLALDPLNTLSRSLEGIVCWAQDRDAAEDCERLRERFPEFPEYMFENPKDPEAEELVDPPDGVEEDKPKFPPEVERQLDSVWDEFNAIKSPTAEEAEALVERLLGLPHEATDWSEVFEMVCEAKHPEALRIFDRMISTISPTGNQGLAFLCWGAMEEASKRNETERFPGIAHSFQQLDSKSCDPDALSHVEDILLAAGFTNECLDLMEHFLPILRDSHDLVPWGVPRAATKIITLRIGNLVASGGLSETDADRVLAGLLDGIEDEIDVDLIGRLVRRLLDGPDQARSREEFQLPLDNEAFARQKENWIVLECAFAEVARHEWKTGHGHPGRTLIGLGMMQRSANRWIDSRREKKRRFRGNLFDYLDPQHIERQVVGECDDFLGINPSRAHTMLDAHAALARWAEEEGLLSASDSEKIRQKVGDLLKKVGAED